MSSHGGQGLPTPFKNPASHSQGGLHATVGPSISAVYADTESRRFDHHKEESSLSTNHGQPGPSTRHARKYTPEVQPTASAAEVHVGSRTSQKLHNPF
ncbi:hypothetical protein SUGI_0630150 [Cryptomeria japonica]|nr:hypothetical protein SUGI_0630150 [Cryptomeria japonica]